MDNRHWTDVDTYLAQKTIPADSVLEATLAANKAAGLPNIDVSPTHGKLLQLLVRMHRAQRILEIGTLGGYSTICMARALPADGRLVTLEADPRHAEVASANINRAGLSGRVEIRTGAALETLPVLHEESAGPFDFFFIDADKRSNADYVSWALRLAHRGSVIIVDNVVRHGHVLDADSDDADILGTRRLFDLIAAEPRLDATAVQTVGNKGWDGFVLAMVD